MPPMHQVAALVTLGAYLAFAAPVHADRWRLTIGRLPAVQVEDSTSYLRNLEQSPGDREPLAGLLALLAGRSPLAAAAASAAPPAATAPSVPGPHVPGLVPFPAAITAAPDVDMASLFDESPRPAVDPDIRNRLAGTYGIAVPEDVDAIWALYLQQDPALDVDARLGNAVVKYVLMLGRAPFGSRARPEALKPGATSGTVLGAAGVLTHAYPGGPWTRTSYVQGTVLDLIPPANGPWYRVRTATGTLWVCGLFLDLR